MNLSCKAHSQRNKIKVLANFLLSVLLEFSSLRYKSKLRVSELCRVDRLQEHFSLIFLELHGCYYPNQDFNSYISAMKSRIYLICNVQRCLLTKVTSARC
ncbi:unnamed protein product [Moneuplotes crassus]|uniref:Uncharacterized protein n=1 Tax=Euplotes crassus TaxID=5936 RepID=A0AAD1UMC2_EUPCR|nr:unnamed protein product [Moneuplotes crassus]